ncbi:restriction endonuclease subunit S [Ligilactobacillus salivarius]
MFPTQFTGASFTWERKKLGDVAKITPGGTPSKNISNYWYPKEIPWLSSGEINKEIIFSTDDMISKEGFNNSSAKWIKQDSVLIALAGQGKTRGKVAINRIPLTTNQSIAGIEPSNEVYYKFLYHQLTKDYLKLRLVSSGDGSRGGLNKKLLNDYAVNLSSIDEQHKLGILLSRIDNTLQLHERKCEELTLIKKALLQKLFPKEDKIKPEVRYKNFSDVWEQQKLGEVVNLRGRIGFRGYKQTDLVDKGQGAISFSPADIDEFGNVLNCNNKYISWAKYDESPEIQIAQGDILFTKTASIGKIGYITKLREKATINPQIALITPLKNENGYFIFLSLRLDQFTKKVRNIIGGSSVPTLSQEKLKLLTFMYPDTSEQKEIGDFFKQLDSLIALHQRKFEKLKQLKKFLLQNMFI